MTVLSLDHVNIRTARLRDLIAFYQNVIGLRLGERPAFHFDGAWLYSGNRAIIHLVAVSAPAQSAESHNEIALEHFALRSESDNLTDFLAHLRQHHVPYRIGIVPGLDICQVNIYDPDGNHIHIDFASYAQADLADYAGTD